MGVACIVEDCWLVGGAGLSEGGVSLVDGGSKDSLEEVGAVFAVLALRK